MPVRELLPPTSPRGGGCRAERGFKTPLQVGSRDWQSAPFVFLTNEGSVSEEDV